MKAYSFSSSTSGYTLILGLGETGLAAAQWYIRQSQPVRLADTRAHYEAQVDTLQQLFPAAHLDVVLGDSALDLSVLDDVTTVVISPGLAVTDPLVMALLQQAEQQGIRVISEVEVFALALRDLATQGYTPQVLAVTGTNGKTTVVQMLNSMLQAAQLSVGVGGNISPAALAALMHALDEGQLPQVWLIELSSFQLAHTYSLPIHASVVLNVTQDHLDWHGSFDAYAQAKAAIYAMSAVAVCNKDEPTSLALAPATIPQRMFALQPPTAEGDMGIVSDQGQDWISTLVEADGRLQQQLLLPAAALQVTGTHNRSNALAALALARTLGIDWSPLLEGLRHYYGEPHRCQFVRAIHEVLFVNDSKGTNVGATVAAVQGLDTPFVLIAGGVAKGQDFLPLKHALQQKNCRGAVLIGADAAQIAQCIESVVPVLKQAQTMAEAVALAFSLAKAGDCILLSPACASLDMFANYIERGHVFVDAVQELALDHGEVV